VSVNNKNGKHAKAVKNGKAAVKAADKPPARDDDDDTFVVLQRPTRLPSLAVVSRRFGPLLGKRFTRNNLEVLAHVHAAYSGLKRAERRIRGRGVNIFTQWVGDPDALGSAILLKAILERLGAKEVRILTGSLGHPQNRNLVEKCGIVLRHPNHDIQIARIFDENGDRRNVVFVFRGSWSGRASCRRALLAGIKQNSLRPGAPHCHPAPALPHP
jgi:hypothetical protein